jgi:hypothetical protein
MEDLRARLELRARSLDIIGIAKHGTMTARSTVQWLPECEAPRSTSFEGLTV